MYGRSLGQKRFETALSSLFDFIQENEGDFELWDRSFTLQQIGNIYFEIGKTGLAKFYFDISIGIDPSSLLTKLGYARFVGICLGDHLLASKICDEVIAAAQSAPETSLDDDLSPNEYVNRAESLKNELGDTGGVHPKSETR